VVAKAIMVIKAVSVMDERSRQGDRSGLGGVTGRSQVTRRWMRLTLGCRRAERAASHCWVTRTRVTNRAFLKKTGGGQAPAKKFAGWETAAG